MHTLQCFGYDTSTARWTGVSASAPEMRRERLVVVTFNIWFAEFLWRERLAVLLDLVLAEDPDIIALQEVTPSQLRQILAVDKVRKTFYVSDVSGETLEPHGVLLLSRLPMYDLALEMLPSDKDRKLLLASLNPLDHPLRVGALHLESASDATPVRLAQLDRVLPLLRNHPHALLMGDFNFDPSQEPEQRRIDRPFTDLWEELRPHEPGYTEDTDINRMRLLHKGKEKQVRFDRILLRSTSPGWVPETVRLIGTRPLERAGSKVFPSDHFGLAGSLVWDGAE